MNRLWVQLSGAFLAVALVAGAVVGRLFLAPAMQLGPGIDGPLTGLVMSLGAGLYEEIAFRVVLFGLGLRCLRVLWPSKSWWRRALLASTWAVLAAATFSAWHHLGSLGEAFEGRVFVFRMVCGLVFTVIYVIGAGTPLAH